MKKVLALVVAAAMGLSSAAFAAETATTPVSDCDDHQSSAGENYTS